MSDEFYAKLFRALGARGFEGRGQEVAAQVVLLRAPHGAYLGLYFRGRSVAYWGPLVSIYVAMRKQCALREGLALAIVLVSGDLGYVLDEARIEKYRHGWYVSQSDKRKANFQLNDDALAGFPMFRGPEACADLLLSLVSNLPPCREDLTVTIFKRQRKRRRSYLDDFEL